MLHRKIFKAIEVNKYKATEQKGELLK